VVDGEGPHAPLVAACEEAARLLGLGAAAALARCPELRLIGRDRELEEAALAALAAWAGRFTPQVSRPASGTGLLLEIGASLTLHGGLERLREALERGLRALGHRAALGIAPTPLGAWLLARAGLEEAPPDRARLRAVLATVPLACTDLPPETVTRLAAMGVRRIGECRRLPRAGLARRFGPQINDYLDRAFGARPDPQPRHRPPARFERQLVVPVAIADRGALERPARRLLEELGGFLAARGLATCALELHLRHERRGSTRLHLALGAPSRDPDHLLALLRERLARLALPGPVVAVGLRAVHLEALAARSAALFDRDPLASHAALDEERMRLLERLRARLGAAAVHGIAGCDDHRPERAWRPVTGVAARAGRRGEAAAPVPGRPLWLLAVARPLEVRGGGPWLGGTLRRLRGPERIESGWWESGGDVRRDYYEAANPAGERYWIYRERGAARRWYLHGIFG